MNSTPNDGNTQEYYLIPNFTRLEAGKLYLDGNNDRVFIVSTNSITESALGVKAGFPVWYTYTLAGQTIDVPTERSLNLFVRLED